MPPKARKFVYDNHTALGHAHMPKQAADARRRAVDPNVPDEDPVAAERHRDMHEMDLHPGTEVTHIGRDEDRDLELVEWTDRLGNPRITSIAPDHFAEKFKEV